MLPSSVGDEESLILIPKCKQRWLAGRAEWGSPPGAGATVVVFAFAPLHSTETICSSPSCVLLVCLCSSLW